MLTAREFAAEVGISYPVIIRWLKEQQSGGEQRLPGAKQTEVGRLKAWQIPASLVTKLQKSDLMPKRGWKKGRKRKTEMEERVGENGGDVGTAATPKPTKKAGKKAGN